MQGDLVQLAQRGDREAFDMQAVAGTLGEDDVGVVEEPVDGRGGEGLGHDRVEARGVEVGVTATLRRS